jgi:FlaA1/EpsC-like NDP-sugar epimerase
MIGAGPVARVLAQRLLAQASPLRPIGFLDELATHRKIAGLPLLGHPDELPEIARRTAAGAAVLAMPELDRARTAELAGLAWSAGLDLRWLSEQPAPGRLGAIGMADLSELRLAALLGREEMINGAGRARPLVEGHRVLVTGAGGPVGHLLANELTAMRPAGLWAVEDEDLADERAVAGLLARARPHLVLHAPEERPLGAGELDPCTAVKGTLLATQRLVDAAVAYDVRRFVLMSGGRAVDPVSVDGAVGRLTELVAQAVAGGRTRVATVRMGTLLGTGGSLLDFLARRIPRGETVEVPHPEAAALFMTAGEAAGLMLESAALVEAAEIFALDLGGPLPLVELVHGYAELLRVPQVTIRFTGLERGERLTDACFGEGEERMPTAHPAIWSARPAPAPPGLRALLEPLYEAASQGDDAAVRLLLRRLLPEYRPARGTGRQGRAVAAPLPGVPAPGAAESG